MKCSEAEAIFTDYLDNLLDEGLRLELEKHLETCERCLGEIRESQQLMQIISDNKMEKPDDSMRINFYHMLHTEIEKSEGRKNTLLRKSAIPWYNRSLYRSAAGIALLICGTFLGLFIHSELINPDTANELKLLQSEVSELKKAAMFTMLKEVSSSDRIQAVSYVDDIDNPDENVIEVLIRTLNQDKNVNVRMAAAYALAKFADNRSVCDSLVRSLYAQDDPILQVTLINILVERKERGAIKPMQQIIGNEKTLKEVKAVALNGMKQLI
jgi:hypothetical protein